MSENTIEQFISLLDGYSEDDLRPREDRINIYTFDPAYMCKSQAVFPVTVRWLL